MLYRSANLNDSDQLISLWEKAGLSYGQEQDRREIKTRLESNDDLFVVGVDDAGNIRCSVMGCYDNHRGWVKRFAVDPAIARTGQGKALFGELEQRFLAAGITKLRLAVWGDNHAAAAFWEAQGFADFEGVRYMGKEITAARGPSSEAN